MAGSPVRLYNFLDIRLHQLQWTTVSAQDLSAWFYVCVYSFVLRTAFPSVGYGKRSIGFLRVCVSLDQRLLPIIWTGSFFGTEEQFFRTCMHYIDLPTEALSTDEGAPIIHLSGALQS